MEGDDIYFLLGTQAHGALLCASLFPEYLCISPAFPEHVCVRHSGSLESESKSLSPETVVKAEHPELKVENIVSSHTHRSKSIIESCHQVTLHKI